MPHDWIDSHHHLWLYHPSEYPWMSENMEALRRDYLFPDLRAVTGAVGITGTVAVQARQCVQETEWLSAVAAEADLIRGVVGWAPLANPHVRRDLERLAALPKVKGMRHLLHDEPDPGYMCRSDFNRGISLLKEYDLRYDLLIFEKHLAQTIDFVDRHPNQIFIIDHLAKPRIREKVLSPWRENMMKLALRENVYCKISGMVTEAEWKLWQAEDLLPYFETVLEAFGARRSMFGSDWPVLTLAASFDRWANTVRQTIGKLSEHEQMRILAGTAIEAYDL